MDINGYQLSRVWFDFCFDNPEKVNPTHTAIYFFAIEHCNRLGWKEKFGFPTQMTMDALGIKKHQTYIKYFNELCEWGFFKLVEKSRNQYSANIISLQYAKPKNGKALDKAFITHAAKQGSSNGQSKDSIDKPITNNQLTTEPLFDDFDKFWNLYGKKIDQKKCKEKWAKLPKSDRDKIFETLPLYVKSTPELKFRKHPLTYINGKCWDDELPSKSNSNGYNGRNSEGLVL